MYNEHQLIYFWIEHPLLCTHNSLRKSSTINSIHFRGYGQMQC